uniref:Serine/threonine/tyrosine-interacting-like protein 1 n=1 Tax=Ciona intestinalis TaxID=7719 RepID=F6V2G1_CIOIN|nr:serine/threonine/tyrosine-interacting-like protein 1 [Ciona intestinalis]|eukprot:XP_002127762.1 serine/threonine/tyrosine-interacting-like protein 1 [Ciona intestinalis]
MSRLVLIEPTELYNILNQHTVYPCLSDQNFLLLLDARKKTEYDESHVITAKRAPVDEEGNYNVPYDSELECKTHVIVYDSNCRSLREKSRSVFCASVMANNGSKNPVKILRGGYEDFSAMYPFLRTQKIIYMPREYDNIETYPCEVLPGILYIGSKKQAQSNTVHKELKIRAHINLSNSTDKFFKEGDENYLQVPISDDENADFTSYIPQIVKFVDDNRNKLNIILVWSDNGISRSAAACILYLMSYYKWPLQDAWRHMRSCKFTMRPNRGLVKQLAAFEESHLGSTITNIADPHF